MLQTILYKRLNGGALYYAIFIMIVLGMLSILFFNYFELTYREDTLLYKNAELEDQVSSAITKISCSPEMLIESGTMVLDVFDNGEALINIATTRWGFMRRVVASIKWKHLVKSKIVLLGEMDKSQPALWMPDRNRYVSLVGKSKIIGEVYVSDLGLRSGNIEGRYFEGTVLHEGKTHTAEEKMPQLKDEIISWFHGYLASRVSATDSLVDFKSIKNEDLIKQSFAEKTLVLQSPRNVSLERGGYYDNIIVVATDTIEVWPSTVLKDVVLIANVVIFKRGFEGRLQAFAARSLIVEDNCNLLYPSYIAAIGTSAEVKVTIGKACKINGGIVCFSQNAEEGKTILAIGNTDEIIGKVYTNGDMKMSGRITGSLYCNRFTHETQRAFYENFMIDLVLDEKSLPKEYASFSMTGELFKLKLVRQCHYYPEE